MDKPESCARCVTYHPIEMCTPVKVCSRICEVVHEDDSGRFAELMSKSEHELLVLILLELRQAAAHGLAGAAIEVRTIVKEQA